MDKINCIIIDDDTTSQKIIKQHIEAIKYLRLTHSFSDPARSFEILKNDIYKSIVFIDITIKGIDSSTFFNNLKPFHLAIITTDKRNDAIVAYEKGAIDFLLKPVSFSRFLKAVTKARLSLSLINGKCQKTDKIKTYSEKDRMVKYFDSPLTDEHLDSFLKL